jgi:hypothetical protein
MRIHAKFILNSILNSDAPRQQFSQASIEIRYRQQSIHLRFSMKMMFAPDHELQGKPVCTIII